MSPIRTVRVPLPQHGYIQVRSLLLAAMLFSLCIAALSLLVCAGSTSPVERVKAPKPRAAPGTLASTDNYLSLVQVKAARSRGRHGPHKPHGRHGQNADVVSLDDLLLEDEWAATITFGGEDVIVTLDTGSSDTWLAQKGFQCVDMNGTDIAEADCSFGPTYNGTFTGGAIANENFNISYGSGLFLTGDLGYTDITIGDITVKHQTVALVNEAYWIGDGITSGLMGLAYSALTSAFAGDNLTVDNFNVTGTAPGDQELYSPVVQTMIAQGLNPPLFTLALERSSDLNDNAPGGYIAFGGIPPVSGTIGSFFDTPILIHEYFAYPPLEAVNRSFYSILPDAYVYESNASVITTYPTTYDAIVDSGTTLLYVPTAVANGFIASFNPPATLYEGYYYYPCDATAPYFGVKIAGETFNINPADLILPYSPLGGNGFVNDTTGVEYCLIGVIDGGSGVETFPIFGDVFLKNVVAVFDVGASIMRFAQHTY